MRNNILDHIGNTPLVEIRRLNPNPRVRLLAKRTLEQTRGLTLLQDTVVDFILEAAEGAFGDSAERRIAGVVRALLCSAIFMMINRAVYVLIRECLSVHGPGTAANFS